ncbi:MAG: arginine decarboxylase, pyruvoyl-dependent [Planctomycetota bacterium]|nr:MAG: arginine decarboxylase, pyruvoyl-dependent [Planctomycetota bacterium]
MARKRSSEIEVPPAAPAVPPYGFVPRKVFFTRGFGIHRERLSSFEMALRKAGIASFNLVTVSSIYPAKCRRVTREEGLSKMTPGQIVFCVMARQDTNEKGRSCSAGIGVAVPRDKARFGYLSEHHGFGMTEKETEDYVEDLAVEMLCTVMGVEYNASATWDEKREIWKISGNIYDSFNVVQAKEGVAGHWVTCVAAAVFCA